jgi:prepilin-type N-terminal cleavage/methylation domain-containing protein
MNFPVAFHRSRGFTLIEVVVAITLIGLVYTLILSAMSGSLKLVRQASELENAILLARSKLDEAGIDSSMDIADEDREEKYGGVTYAYKIEIRDLPFIEPQLAERIRLPFKLEEITVEVYWGEKGRERHYRLTSIKMKPLQGANPAPSADGPVQPPPRGGGMAS